MTSTLLLVKWMQVTAPAMGLQDFRATQILCCLPKPVHVPQAITYREAPPSIQFMRKALVIAYTLILLSGYIEQEVNRGIELC